jgi:hypothetical protein
VGFVQHFQATADIENGFHIFIETLEDPEQGINRLMGLINDDFLTGGTTAVHNSWKVRMLSFVSKYCNFGACVSLAEYSMQHLKRESILTPSFLHSASGMCHRSSRSCHPEGSLGWVVHVESSVASFYDYFFV